MANPIPHSPDKTSDVTLPAVCLMPTAGMGTTSQGGTNPSVLNPVGSASSIGYNVGQGMTTANAEALGDGTAGNAFNEMAFSIEKVTVTAKSRALKG